MRNLKLVLAAFILAMGISTAAFADKPKDGATNKTDIKAPVTPETKTQATQMLLYWFDAHTGIYIGHEISAGCDESNENLCAKGYSTVSDPLHPTEPAGNPTATEDGVRQ